MDWYKKLQWPAEPVTLDDVVENTDVWAVFKQFQGDFEGVFVLYFWWGLYKTKTLAKFVENRKCYRSPLLLQARIMFGLFSSDFKTILKGSSFLGLRSSVFGLRFVPNR